ncbi:MAG: hypothetical protein EP330_00500 [Deltaproteobacteria bacterium]|nr:MAG: hypothetical protein EP330_00500 [Deltaproteobacteria bacterium]
MPTAASSPNEVSEPAQNPTEAAATTKVSVNSTFTNDLEIRYWRVPDRLDGYEDREVLNYFEQVDRFTAHVSTDSGWQAFAQVDQVMLTANAYKLDGVYTKERTLRGPDLWWVGPERWDVYVNPEKLYIGKKSGNVTWRVGDFYEAFGYGAALNVNRNVDIDIDTSIQGARLFWQPGAWDVTILGGQLNRQQVFQDNPNIGLRGDLRHFVTGAQVKRFGLGPMNIGAHAVAYNFVDEAGISAGFSELGSPMDAVVTGASAELAASFDLNGEVDLFTHPSGQLNDEPGYLAYGSAAFYIGSTTWQLEGKRYKDAERLNSLTTPELYEVGIAPTLEYERAITEDSSATVNSNDVYGGRLRMDWSAVPGRVVPYASFAVFRDLDTAGLHFNEVPETVIHPLVGVEAVGEGVNVLLNAGYRVDMRDGGGESDRQLHGDIDFKFPVVAQTHADINAAIEYYQWGDNGALQQNDYVEMETATTFLLHEPEIAFIWYTDVTTNPLIDSKGNLADLLYGAFEIQYKPADAWTLKAFYGAYKAGIRCSGGQCRQLPGFEGGRVSVVGNF